MASSPLFWEYLKLSVYFLHLLRCNRYMYLIHQITFAFTSYMQRDRSTLDLIHAFYSPLRVSLFFLGTNNIPNVTTSFILKYY